MAQTKRKKRFLPMLLTGALVATTMFGSVSAFAGDGDTEDESTAAYTWTDEDGNVLESGITDTGTQITLSSDGVFTLEEDLDRNVVVGASIEVTIDLAGHTLTGDGTSSVIWLYNNADVTLTDSGEGGTVTGGAGVNGNGGGVYLSAATFTLEDGAISGNSVSNGGAGIYAGTGSTVTINGGEISNNTAGSSTTGGGIFISSSSSAVSSLTINGGEITGNTGTSGGGVQINTYSTFTMTGGEITGNTATGTSSSQGGGVNLGSYATATITGGVIANNTAYKRGADIAWSSLTTSVTLTSDVNSGGVIFGDSGREITGWYADGYYNGASVDRYSEDSYIEVDLSSIASGTGYYMIAAYCPHTWGYDEDSLSYSWAWTETDDGYTAEITFDDVTCNDCGESYAADVTVTSDINDDGDTVYTATATGPDGETYTDTKTVEAASDDTGDDTSGNDTTTDDTTGGTSDDSSSSDSSSGNSSSTTTEEESSYTVITKKTASTKISLTGATESQLTKVFKLASGDGDFADSSYALLQAKAKTVTKKSVKVTWKKVSGAKYYVIYGNQCGTSNKYKKLKKVSSSKTSVNFKKVAGKSVKSGKSYKFIVVALDKNGEVIETSKTIHAVTKGGKQTNTKTLKAYKGSKKVTKVSVKKGKSVKIKTKATKQVSGKKLSKHRAVKYESSNSKIAKVNASGKITGVKKGTCYVYAYAANGVSAKVKVTVK